MAYSPLMVQPMRDEVTRLGVQELRTVDDVDTFLGSGDDPSLLFVNSVCGCAAGNARPALMLALEATDCPPKRATVFAGQDPESTARVRDMFADIPASSPCFYVIKNDRVVGHVPRAGIEGHTAEAVAFQLRSIFKDLNNDAT